MGLLTGSSKSISSNTMSSNIYLHTVSNNFCLRKKNLPINPANCPTSIQVLMSLVYSRGYRAYYPGLTSRNGLDVANPVLHYMKGPFVIENASSEISDDIDIVKTNEVDDTKKFERHTA